MRRDNTLIIFTKALHICRVKTRLWPALSHRECLLLYRLLLQSTIEQLIDSNQYNIVIYSTAIHTRRALPYNLSYKIQRGHDLGVRMHNAINNELNYAQRVMLIGSDCFNFTMHFIESAFKRINKGNDIIVSPTVDGGYCLIGMQSSHQELFKHISWSTDYVLQQTQHNAKQHGKNLMLTEYMHDIDTINDLHVLNKKNQLPAWAQTFIRS